MRKIGLDPEGLATSVSGKKVLVLPNRAGWAALIFAIVAGAAGARGQSISVSPISLSFGTQALGTTSAAKLVTLKNGQTSAITISSISSSLADYIQTNNCPASPSTLGAGKSCSISLTFAPAALGPRSATLTISDSGTSSPQTVSLTGTGITAVSATPTALNFGKVVIGQPSAPQTVTIKNNENTPLTISSVGTNLPDYSITTTCPIGPQTLAAGTSCTISIVFRPAVLGTRSATLTVADNASNSPSIALTGAGVVAASIVPGSLTFSNQALGTTSAAQTVTFTNNQSNAVTINSIASNSTDFAVTSSCPISPNTLAAGISCTASVRFSPKAIGTRTGKLTFQDSASNSPQIASLSGTGTAPALVSIAVTPSNPSFALGTYQALHAVGTYSDGSTLDITSSVIWTTSNSTVATVSSQGTATSVSVGSTTATATSGSIAGTTMLTVSPAALVSIAVTPAIPAIPLGRTQQFSATGTFTDGTIQDVTTTVQWSSDTPGTATISNSAGSQGLATGVGAGTATITAASGSVHSSTTLTVTSAMLVSIAVSPATTSIALGTTQGFTATGTYTDNSTQNLTLTVAWSSDTPAVATINTSGLASSAGQGTATITASLGSVQGSTRLTVTAAALVSIAVNPPSATAPVGTTEAFTATGTYTDGSTQDLTQVGAWSSTSAAAATVSNTPGTQGLASALSVGATTIAITVNGASGTAGLTVSPAALVSITLTPANATIALGETQQFAANGTYTDGSTQDVTTSVQWSSASAQVAVISNEVGSQGLATSAGAGTTTISATLSGVSGTTGLTVGPGALTSIAITPANPTIPLGTTIQLGATGTFSDGSTADITTTVTWSSDQPTVASVGNAIGNQGLTTGLVLGSANIMATQAGISATNPVTVAAPVLMSIGVSPSSPTAPSGTSLQMSASGVYSDGSVRDITAMAAWSTSDPGIAIIGAGGLASPLATGTVVITASIGAISGSGNLTVTDAGLVASAFRAELNLNGVWNYTLNQPQSQIPNGGWIQARIPQAPLTNGTASVWYQTTLNVPSAWMQRNRRFFLELEKAGHYAAVYVNGVFMGDHFGQFSPFEVEVTSAIVGGQNNSIAIYVHKADTSYVRRGVVVNQSSCSASVPDCLGNSYRPFGPDGIQRNWVGLVGDITFSWRPAEYISDVSVITSVRNSTIGAALQVTGSDSATSVQATVLDGEIPVLTLPAASIIAGTASITAPWSNPTLWGTPPYGTPKLYILRTTLLENGIPIDTIYTRFGFREVWVSGKTVLFNGQPLWLTADYMPTFAPVRNSNDRRPQAMQLNIMQKSGMDGFHNHWDDPGRSWLELADEMGIPVLAQFYCSGADFTEAQVDDAIGWMNWMTATAQEWAHARKNHPSIIMWRPMDVLAKSAPPKTMVYPALAAAVRSQDPSARPIADGSDVDTWAQSVISTSNPTQCDTGSAFAAQLASETKPLLFKELYGFGLSCSQSFVQTVYQMAHSGGAIGLIVQQLTLQSAQTFTPAWFSSSGKGNRPSASDSLPNWLTQQWNPTGWSQTFTNLYQSGVNSILPDASPTSGEYQATQLPASVQSAFLVPSAGTGNPVGVTVAADGTAWFVVPLPGSYLLAFSNGTSEALQSVTATLPSPFP